MNPSEQQVAIQEISTKYRADLEQWESRFKNCISDFLTSDVTKCLVIETWNSKLSALHVMQMLKQLKEDDGNQNLLGRYLNGENQTFFSWKQLLDVADPTGSFPRFTNLLVCEFPLSMKMEEIDSTLLNKITHRLNLATSKKVIFIVSEQGLLDSYLKKIEMEACLKIDGFGTKIISSIYASEAEALVEGAANGHLNDVVKLLKDGVNVNAASGSSTALLAAVKNGHKDVVLTLLRNGADVVSVESQQFLLHVAAGAGHKDIVLVLLEHDIDVNIKDETGCTALHHAVIEGYIDIVTILLEYNAEVNDRRNWDLIPLDLVDVDQGNTVLTDAILYDYTDLVDILVRHGADVNVRDYEGSTPCHNAAATSNIEILETLLASGADPNAKNRSGYTPLHIAAIGNRFGVVKALMKKGADVSLKNYKNETPLDIATENHYDAVAALLRNV